jgi:hypothetical protein
MSALGQKQTFAARKMPGPLSPRKRTLNASFPTSAEGHIIIVEFAQEQAERFPPGAIGLSHSAETDLGLFDPAFSSGAIDFPFPRA